MRTREAAYLLGISCQRLRVLLSQGRVRGASKKNGFWEIPTFGDGMPVIVPGKRGPEGTWRHSNQEKPAMIHVNQQFIKGNAKKIKDNPGKQINLMPVLSWKHGERNDYGYQLEIKGSCIVVYRPYQPADCGAQLWINTYSEVQFIDIQSNPVLARQPYQFWK